mmetsp:Transcript_25713/g.65343  ORF Transcript_25713/g.65343 Transcript_25713/m.65343 type:complete len:436 (+) Transcript_25713:749-2056(+)
MGGAWVVAPQVGGALPRCRCLATLDLQLMAEAGGARATSGTGLWMIRTTCVASTAMAACPAWCTGIPPTCSLACTACLATPWTPWARWPCLGPARRAAAHWAVRSCTVEQRSRGRAGQCHHPHRPPARRQVASRAPTLHPRLPPMRPVATTQAAHPGPCPPRPLAAPPASSPACTSTCRAGCARMACPCPATACPWVVCPTQACQALCLLGPCTLPEQCQAMAMACHQARTRILWLLGACLAVTPPCSSSSRQPWEAMPTPCTPWVPCPCQACLAPLASGPWACPVCPWPCTRPCQVCRTLACRVVTWVRAMPCTLVAATSTAPPTTTSPTATPTRTTAAAAAASTTAVLLPVATLPRQRLLLPLLQPRLLRRPRLQRLRLPRTNKARAIAGSRPQECTQLMYYAASGIQGCGAGILPWWALGSQWEAVGTVQGS